jgi:phosphodiesterase/alkaline phosphatase D-like protein
MGPTRRELLQLLGTSTALLAMGCGGDAAESATAVLDPGIDSLVVAIWSPAVRDARITVRAGDRLVAEAALALSGASGALEVTGLEPDTAYEITIALGEIEHGPHRVRTAPRPDDPRPVRIAIAADYDPDPAFASGIVDALIAAQPELVISIGDFPYTDNGPPAQTAEQYRARHVETRRHPPVRALLEASGLAAIYDDHEFRNDWDARFSAAEPERRVAALTVWDEFFPLRAPAGEIRYRSWRWGANLECFLLDCRRFRSANDAPDDARKTMLGAEQLGWLIDGVTGSTATFKLVLTAVPLDFGFGRDHWAGFTTERDALFAALIGVPGVVFVSGDQHWFASHRHAFGIREIQIGPLARGVPTPPPGAPGVLFRAARYNAGIVEVAGDQLTLIGLGDDGPFYRETLIAAELTPRP